MRAKVFRGTVLLVTGDERLRSTLQYALLQAGYGVRTARTQEEAIHEFSATTPAILLIDRRDSGFSRLRHETPDLPPIVTIMYHNDPCDDRHCLMDLEDGATRALCNAGPAIVVALLGAVLRRQRMERPSPEHYVADGVTIDVRNYEVTVDTMPVHMSPTEFRILKSLVSSPGQFLSRKALLDQVWGEGFAIFPHTLDVHISSLRHKLDPAGKTPPFIMTVKGLGFKLRPAAAAPLHMLPVRSYGAISSPAQYAAARTPQHPEQSATISMLPGSVLQRRTPLRNSRTYKAAVPE